MFFNVSLVINSLLHVGFTHIDWFAISRRQLGAQVVLFVCTFGQVLLTMCSQVKAACAACDPHRFLFLQLTVKVFVVDNLIFILRIVWDVA